jgi:outer membrane protein
MRKTAIVGIGILVAMLFAGTSLAQGIRIAVIDVNKVLNQSEAGKVAKKKMEARYEELKKNIETKQEEAKKLKDEIDKQKVMLGKDKLKEKEDALAARVNELRKLTQESEREMQGRQGELTREVLKQIEAQVETVVKAEKYDLVLERSGGVVHVVESMDITNRVLELVNKGPQAPAAAKEPAPKKAGGAKKEAGSGK